MGQTVLSSDQNLLERLENATQIQNNHYIKDNMGQIVLRPIQFSNAFETENSMSLWWNLRKMLYGQNGSNYIACIVSSSEFARNILKFKIDRCICDFDKYWPKFTKWTVRINTYCPWLEFWKNISSSKKELSMEHYVEYLKGQYSSLTNMVQTFTWSEYFVKTFETEKKAWAFNGNLIGSLKRKITVKPCCAWYNF